MTELKMTIGRAIDQTIEALASLDKREQLAVIATVCSVLQLDVATHSIDGASPRDGLHATQSESRTDGTVGSNKTKMAAHESHRHQSGIDIRTLKDQKQPDSARQMACLVAFYLQEHAPEGERKQVVTTSDLDRYFKQAGYRLPAKLAQVLPDAKTAGYFEGAARGEYKLTRVGYNLVTHSMPKSSQA